MGVSIEFSADELSSEHVRFGVAPPRQELERFFVFDDQDRKLVRKRRGDHNRLGFGVQLGTVRYLGMFLPDPVDVPQVVVEYVAEQLGITDAGCVKRYGERLPTQHEHTREIGGWGGSEQKLTLRESGGQTRSPRISV